MTDDARPVVDWRPGGNRWLGNPSFRDLRRALAV